MSNHNAFPTPEEYKGPKLVRYQDGLSAMVYDVRGESLKLGYGSDIPHASRVQSPAGGDWVVIRTASGNRYGLGQGIIFNVREQKAAPLPRELSEIKIGEPWVIPGLGNTSEVDGVDVLYKHIPERTGGEQADEPNPFPDIQRSILKAADILY